MSSKPAPDPTAATARGVTWLGAAIALHCVLGIARVPHAVIGKRWQEVAGLERDGEVTWLMETAGLEGAAAILELRATTAPDAIVVVRGPFKGPLEYAARLLWPRLCYSGEGLPPGSADFLGRPIAPLALVSALVSDDAVLRLEPR